MVSQQNCFLSHFKQNLIKCLCDLTLKCIGIDYLNEKSIDIDQINVKYLNI